MTGADPLLEATLLVWAVPTVFMLTLTLMTVIFR